MSSLRMEQKRVDEFAQVRWRARALRLSTRARTLTRSHNRFELGRAGQGDRTQPAVLHRHKEVRLSQDVADP